MQGPGLGGVKLTNTWGSVSGMRNYKCKGPEMGSYFLSLNNSNELEEAGEQLSEVNSGRG